MRTLVISILAATVLAGCSSWDPLAYIHPYHIPIQQGNVVTQSMLDQLKPGMTEAQVRFVLGTPLIVDPFHKDRWDYPYMLNKNGRLVAKRHITVFFENGKFKGLSGDVKPEAKAGDKAAPAPAAKTGAGQ